MSGEFADTFGRDTLNFVNRYTLDEIKEIIEELAKNVDERELESVKAFTFYSSAIICKPDCEPAVKGVEFYKACCRDIKVVLREIWSTDILYFKSTISPFVYLDRERKSVSRLERIRWVYKYMAARFALFAKTRDALKEHIFKHSEVPLHITFAPKNSGGKKQDVGDSDLAKICLEHNNSAATRSKSVSKFVTRIDVLLISMLFVCMACPLAVFLSKANAWHLVYDGLLFVFRYVWHGLWSSGWFRFGFLVVTLPIIYFAPLIVLSSPSAGAKEYLSPLRWEWHNRLNSVAKPLFWIILAGVVLIAFLAPENENKARKHNSDSHYEYDDEGGSGIMYRGEQL